MQNDRFLSRSSFPALHRNPLDGIASDPAFHADLEAWAGARGEKVLAFEEVDLHQRAVIEKAGQ